MGTLSALGRVAGQARLVPAGAVVAPGVEAGACPAPTSAPPPPAPRFAAPVAAPVAAMAVATTPTAPETWDNTLTFYINGVECVACKGPGVWGVDGHGQTHSRRPPTLPPWHTGTR